MNRKHLFQDILGSIAKFENITDTALEDYLIGDENVVESSKILKGLVINSNLKLFVESIEKIIIAADLNGTLEDDYLFSGLAIKIDFTNNDYKPFNREFIHSEIDFGFFNSRSMFNSRIVVDLSNSDSDELWKLIEDYCALLIINRNSALIDEITGMIANSEIRYGFLINKTAIALDEKRLLSFIYLNHLNNTKSLRIEPSLIYSTTQLNPTLSVVANIEYEQYFDILDVLNEVTLSTDILNRFLKLYHILEFLSYRVSLVKIVRGTNQGKSFVREIIKLSDRIRNSEKKIFMDSFKTIFGGDIVRFNSFITAHSQPGVQRFIHKSYDISGFVPTDIDMLSKLIYALRCSIVHNNESELHLTISNPDDYRLIIDLIKQLIKALEFLVVEKISTRQIKIQYPTKELELY